MSPWDLFGWACASVAVVLAGVFICVILLAIAGFIIEVSEKKGKK